MTSLLSFAENRPKAPLALIATPGARELTKLVDKNLVEWYKSKDGDNSFKKDTFIIDATCPRFTNGDGKGMIMETVRGKDLFIICDVANLKRIICAACGKPERITVVMPMLYAGRQHRRASRESLDCAMMLHELYDMGVSDVITFDAHDPRVQNAVPLMGFDNYFPTYQVLKALTRRFPDISPDEGAMGRNVYYASVLGLDLGMFYKRRDYANVVNGRNPIIAHEYIGSPVMGMNVFVADDMIATGDSVIKLAREIKEKGAQRVFLSATFALFTEGVEKFNKAYEEGLFDAVISTNLAYRTPELRSCEWFVEADMSKYLAYIIAAGNLNEAVSNLLDPFEKIKQLVSSLESK